MEQLGELGLTRTGQSPLVLEHLPAVTRGPHRAGQSPLRGRRGPSGSRRRISRARVKGKGQLKLSIEVRGRTLVLHVMEAKGLMGTECRACNSYVKVSIVPDADWKCRQKTKTVPDSKNPVFHEHFVFPVQEEDEQKRLLVTVWNRERNSRQSELIGCMSFGVKSLLSLDKETSGWYYLLGEDLGRTKHLKVAMRRLKQSTEVRPGSQSAAQESQDAVSLRQLKCILTQDKAAALPGTAGLGLARLLPRSISPCLALWLLGHVCSSPPSRTVCSGKGKAHGGAG